MKYQNKSSQESAHISNSQVSWISSTFLLDLFSNFFQSSIIESRFFLEQIWYEQTSSFNISSKTYMIMNSIGWQDNQKSKFLQKKKKFSEIEKFIRIFWYYSTGLHEYRWGQNIRDRPQSPLASLILTLVTALLHSFWTQQMLNMTTRHVYI
jgi:hypothetical protein